MIKLSTSRVKQYKYYTGLLDGKRLALKAYSKTHGAKIINLVWKCDRNKFADCFCEVSYYEVPTVHKSEPNTIFESVDNQWQKLGVQ